MDLTQCFSWANKSRCENFIPLSLKFIAVKAPVKHLPLHPINPSGVMAFSQGACLTSMLCTMKRTETVLSQISFVMLFNGFRSRITKHDKYYTDLIDTVRSLHVYGETDEVIPLG